MEDLFSAAQNQMMQNQMMQSQCNMQDPMMSGQYDMQNQYGVQNQYGMQNQMYQDPMMSGQYGMQSQMYQSPVGTVDRYGMIKYSKAQYLAGLRDYVIMNCGGRIAINKEEKLEDIPEKLRHCCANSKSKIVLLDKLIFYVQETGMSIPFYFCMDCGKLFYYKDFMM